MHIFGLNPLTTPQSLSAGRGEVMFIWCQLSIFFIKKNACQLSIVEISDEMGDEDWN